MRNEDDICKIMTTAARERVKKGRRGLLFYVVVVPHPMSRQKRERRRRVAKRVNWPSLLHTAAPAVSHLQ